MKPAPTDKQIDRILTAVLELDADAREAYVAEACDGDPELRAIIERALAAALRDDGPLTIGGAGRGSLFDRAEAILIGADEGQRIGPYRVLREIGRGGMGVVYLAERADGAFEQRVALKIVPLGASAETAARLVAERSIQAALTHPGIAKVLDGGVSGEGHPYLAMEYVEGTPIDEYADAKDLPLRKRLALFVDVCRAVEAAHTQLIVHRDLKPSNILVDRNDQVRLLDFGIAKLLSADDVAERTATWIMTPEYSSPEQIRGQPVSLASDVYQLGLLLYRLLAGEKPYSVQGRPPTEAERIICREEVRRPSAITGAHRLRGDLDTIVLKALRKDPEQRYASAEALRGDVERYLDEIPIEARPATMAYRAHKFVRRYPWGVAAVLAILLVGGIYVVTLTAERNRAEAARASAESLSDFLVDLFNGADPVQSPADVTARTLVDRAAERLGERTDLDPLARARFEHTIGGIYVELALLDEAEALLEHALAERRAALPADHRDILTAMIELALVYQRQSRPEDAEPLLREVIERSEATGVPDSITFARALNELGDALRAEEKYADAEEYQRRALAIREAVLGPDHADVANSLNSTANTIKYLHQEEEAVRMYDRALAIYERELGPDHMNVATVLYNAARLEVEDDPAAAEEKFRRSIAIREARFGADHVVLLGTLSALGRLYRLQRDWDQAIALRRRALTIREAAYGETSAEVVTDVDVLSDYLAAAGRWSEALPFDRRHVTALRQTDPGSPDLPMALESLGVAAGWVGEDQEAEASFREALAIHGESDAEPDDLLRLRGDLAWLEWRRNRFPVAEAAFRGVLADMDSAGVSGASWELPPSLYLGLTLSLLDRRAEAETAVRRTLHARQEQFGDDDPRTAEALLALATVLHRAGRLDEAETAAQRAVTALAPVRSEPFPPRDRAEAELASIRAARGAGR